MPLRSRSRASAGSPLSGQKKKIPAIKVVDFFSGCGGTSAGMRAAGLTVTLGLDNAPDAARTFSKNFPEADFICGDIRDVPIEAIEERASFTDSQYLLFCACAPCQPFSKQRRGREKGDERLGLLKEFIRFLDAYRPDLIFMENVPGLQTLSHGFGPFGDFTGALDRLEYHTAARIVNSQDYGVPQRRRRLILIGSHLGPISYPGPTHGPKTDNPLYSTVREWIGDLPQITAGEEHLTVKNHRAANLSALNLERIRLTPEGGGRESWPKQLLPACHRNGYDGHVDVYGRMRWDAPATGLTTRCISYSNGRFGHPEQDRALSVREAACLQTFPRDFDFFGSLNSMARQVGNAVPVLLAQRFGECFLKHVRELERGAVDRERAIDARARNAHKVRV